MYILIGPKRKHPDPPPFFSLLLLTKHPLKLLSIYFSLNFSSVVLYVSIFGSLYHLYHLVSEFGLLGFLIVSYPFIPTKILIATLVYSKQGWLDPTHNINFRNAFLNWIEEKINGQRQLTYFSIFLSLSLQQALISDFQIWLHTVLTKLSISGFHISSSSFDCSFVTLYPNNFSEGSINCSTNSVTLELDPSIWFTRKSQILKSIINCLSL